MVIAGVMLTTTAFAADLEAKVEKNKVTRKYPKVSRYIEYNNFKEADNTIKSLLEANPNDIDALALQAVSMAKQYKLAPAQTQLDKLLKQYPNNADLHYAQGLVYLMRQTSSDVDYIRYVKKEEKDG